MTTVTTTAYTAGFGWGYDQATGTMVANCPDSATTPSAIRTQRIQNVRHGVSHHALQHLWNANGRSVSRYGDHRVCGRSDEHENKRAERRYSDAKLSL